MARIGILGGTFNPPHIGHLACAQEAHWQLELDAVLLMPVAVPPHKQVPDDPGPGLRLELCRAAVGGDERLAVSALEVERGGPSFTVDTLRALHEQKPGDELIFIVGGDAASGLPEWREPEAVLALATLAVAERAGAPSAEVRGRVESVPGGERSLFFEMPRIDVSSSEIRRRVAAGLPIRYLVPDDVARLIGERGLYAAVEVRA